MEKKTILKDSVRNLLRLNISDKEIIENLKSVGIAEEDAREILAETKADDSGKRQSEKTYSIPPVKVPPKNTISVTEKDDDIYSQVYDELEDNSLKTPVIKKPVKNPSYEIGESSGTDVAELWEKGVLATVDAKLAEMQKIRSDINSVIDLKVAEKVQLESKKFQTILDSQRTLYQSKIDSHLEARSSEIHKVVEAKAREVQDAYTKVQDTLTRVLSEKKFSAEMLQAIDDKTTQLDTIRSQMISETNSSIIQRESKFNDFMDDSKQKRSDMEERINRALQLESKITEGLIQDANQKIDRLAIDKERELTQKVQEKITALEEMTRKVDPTGIQATLRRLEELEKSLVERQKEIDKFIDARLSEGFKAMDSRLKQEDKAFDEFKKKVAKIEAGNLEELRKEYAADVDEIFAQNLDAWDKKLREKSKEVDDIKKKFDVEKLNATMESLDLFKEQFVNTVNKSIKDYNKTKTDLAQHIMDRDKAISDYLKSIDEKLQQLSEFQDALKKSTANLPEPKEDKKSKNRK